MKIYDVIFDLLTEYPELRNSDKKLLWSVWHRKGLITGIASNYAITREGFYKAPSSESVTRARRKVQELHPELGATSEKVKSLRRQKENTKGTFIFRQE
mgnify:CR=1 FL=1